MPAGILMRRPMGAPGEEEEDGGGSHRQRAEVRFPRRRTAGFADLSDRFRQQSGARDFQKQFFHVYSRRLEAMRPRLAARAKEEGHRVVALSEMETVGSQEEVAIVGTVFKNQALKPNVLKELAEDQGLPAQPLSSYTSDGDDLILEDSLQRIRLRGEGLDVGRMVTGVVVAAIGKEKESGKFHVRKVLFAPPGPQPERPLFQEDRFVVFLSGLDLASDRSQTLGPLQLAVDWICGEVGEMEDQEFNSTIERVVIAGNSLGEEVARDRLNQLAKAKYLTKDDRAGSAEGVKLLDEMLSELCSSVCVDVMPGEHDPANQLLPQQPLHPCLFPGASKFPMLRTVTNPYSFSLAGFHVVGSSGQNTDDVLRNTFPGHLGCVDALSSLLDWSHLAPTCPDTLGCFPYREKDPFVVEETPHVMFAANQDKFSQKLYTDSSGQEVLLLSLPRFSTTSSAVLLNMKTLKAEEINFCSDYERTA